MSNRFILYLTAALLCAVFTSSIHAQSSAFTYQGQLNDNGAPANGLYDLKFTLYDNDTNGASLGVVTNNTTVVSDGLFTVVLDFGDLFPGADRWLEIAAVTNGGGVFSVLSPRQAITYTPYALRAQTAFIASAVSNPEFLGTDDATPLVLSVNDQAALRLEPPTIGATPNLIGGYSGNNIESGTEGAVIAGGGEAGLENVVGAGSDYSTISGGIGNTIASNSVYTTIGGGTGNDIAGGADQCTVGGGLGNNVAADSLSATISGGIFNFIGTNASQSTIAGGAGNIIAGNSISATISGGAFNDIGVNSASSTIGGGLYNDIASDALFAVIPGGRLNEVGAAASYAFAAGRRAKANHPGTFVWSDSTDADFSSTTNDQFNIRASGGVRFETLGAGMTLDGSAVFAGTDGSTLQSLNASELSTGLIPSSRLVGTYSGRVTFNNPLNVFLGDFHGVATDSAAAPSFTWSGDADTGMYQPAANTVALATAGSERVRVTSAGLVGIGTTAPEGDVHIRGNSSTGSLLVTPNVSNSRSQILLTENTSASLGMIIRYAGDEADNPLHVIGWTSDVESSPLLTVERFGGNVGIGIDDPTEKLHVIGNILATGTITPSSDRNLKKNFDSVNVQEVLERVAALPIQQWTYKAEDDTVRHVGPMAQDFHAAFGLGANDVTIATVDADGVALAAIQGLNEKLNRKETQIAKMERELSELKQLVSKITEKGTR